MLLVDDDPIQLQVRERLLRTAGFPVSLATSAESALAVLSSEPLASHVGVVVTDHFLSGMNGADFVRHLRRKKLTVPVVVVSGQPDVEEEYESLNVVFKSKPCPPAELIGLIRRWLQHAA